MAHQFCYTGCFFDPDDLEKRLSYISRRPLSRSILVPHVTVQFRPECVDDSLFGLEVRVRIKGYGRDENNEGVLVELSAQNPQLMEHLQAIAVPHITLSISNIGKPVNTRNLHFEAVQEVELTGKYGGFTVDHRVITQPLKFQ